MKKIFTSVLILSIICSLITPYNITAFAAYSSLDALQTQINNSGVAGDVYEIADGTYTDISLSISKSGASGNPITIKAKNPGKVIIKGNSYIALTGSYITLEGIRFEDITRTNYPIDIAGSYCTIDDCAFYNFYVPNGTTSSYQWWIRLNGAYNTVINSFFSKKESLALGQMIVSDNPHNHTIKNCYFGDIATQTANGYEAIRLGSSTYQDTDSYSVIEGCFFYMCNGEGETISVKSSNNTIKNNTFYNNNGAISLRHGDDNVVNGNVFIAPGMSSSYNRNIGIIVYGDNQKIHDNYFYNFIASTFAVVLGNGNTEKAPQDAGYDQVTNLKLYNNTMIGGDRFLRLGKYASSTTNIANNSEKAPEGQIYNNAIAITGGTKPVIHNGNFSSSSVMNDSENAVPYHNVTFSNNYMYDKKTIYKEDTTILEGYAGSPDPMDGITTGYFDLVKRDGFYVIPMSGIGARYTDMKSSPKNPHQLLSDWIVSNYYTSKKASFDVLSEDPFNSTTAHINNVIDFDISYGVEGGGGSLSLEKNGIKETKTPVAVSGNPELVFKATPDEGKKVSLWYVNGTPVTKNNLSSVGVSIESVNASFLTINDVSKNFDVKVEFENIEISDYEKLTSPISYFKGISKEPLVVKNHLGEKIDIKGCYTAMAVRIPVGDGYEVSEYGFKISEDGKNYSVKSKAFLPLTSSGGYGMLFYGFGVNRVYYVKPYAVYRNIATGETITLEGSIDSFCVHD